jgi:SnoaL-like protein
VTATTEITATAQADRVAIRELVDAYAHCADRRDASGQKALFTDDTLRRLHEWASATSTSTGPRPDPPTPSATTSTMALIP